MKFVYYGFHKELDAWVEICQDEYPKDEILKNYREVKKFFPQDNVYVNNRDQYKSFFDAIGQQIQHVPDFIKQFYRDTKVRLQEET